MVDSNCVFCKIIAGSIPAEIVHSDERTVAFLVLEPVAEGHLVVVPRAHSRSLELADHVDASALIGAVQRLGPLVCDAVGAEAFNVSFNCGSAAGQEVFHTHVHVIPRRSDDGLVNWPHTPSDAASLAQTALKIRAATER